MNEFPPGRGARVRPDDEIYRVNKNYLGPPGYTLPVRVPYRAIPVAAAVFLPALPVLRLAGLPGLPLYLAALAAALLTTALVVRVTGPERPVSVMVTILAHEIRAPRPVQPPAPEPVTLRPGLIPVGPPLRTRARRRYRG